MHLATSNRAEVQATIEIGLELANGLMEDDFDVRSALSDSGFGRAADASEASLRRLRDRLVELRPLLVDLPDLDTSAAARLVNEELIELPIAPAVVDHDGVGPHMHWTPSTARFDDQVIADLLMALAHELCDHGTDNFGRCGASDCEDLFYDTTRNHSRRFCSDPKCASKTHTAEHRARRGAGGS